MVSPDSTWPPGEFTSTRIGSFALSWFNARSRPDTSRASFSLTGPKISTVRDL
jgi:hypothetical protein